MKEILNVASTLKEDLLNFFYPIYCASCNRQLFKEFEVLCLTCETSLSKTNYHRLPDNPMEKKFWGRCAIEKATALYFYEKKGQVQNILFHLKYKGNETLGKHLGLLMAEELQNTPFRQVDIAAPVPLHPKKQRMRGYNQVHAFAQGFCESMGIELDKDNLIRCIENPSQTNKNRAERWNNVEGIFQLKNPSKWEGKTILLMDDVVTTGATVEACFKAIEQAGVSRVFLISIAVGQ